MEEKFRLQLLMILIKIEAGKIIGLYNRRRTQSYCLNFATFFFLENPSLESLRDEIDRNDEQVVSMIHARVQAAVEIGRIKDKLGVDPWDSLRTIYREVISASIALEKELVIGYLGPEATYTHQAAAKNFGTALTYRPLPDIPDVFQAVEQGECDYGVVPIENSTEGAVNRSLDLLVDTELRIVAQVYLKVEHCLFSESSMSEIQEVRSKDQALAQCGDWLRRNLPQARLVPVSSTAEAVRECKTSQGSAAIAGKLAGGIHDVPLQEEGIQDRKNNTTRFLVVARNSLPRREGVDYRTSLVISLSDQVGALQNALKPFSGRDLNLCKIESRPSGKKTWDYYFFVDFIGHLEDEKVVEAMKELEGGSPFVKHLGSYPETSL